MVRPGRPLRDARAARRGLSSYLVALALTVGVSGCTRTRAPTPRGVLVVSKEQEATWIRNFNPLSPAVSARWPTNSGIYEPLMVHDAIAGRYVPWLAERWEISEDALTFTMHLRPGVHWSDGQLFSAADVAFTFELLKRFPALDRRAIWTFLRSVRATDALTCEFQFDHPYLPGIDDLAAQRPVPAHVWSSVADPVTWPNEHPVATGPFTEVRTFTPQVYEIGRNPHYWQPGKPKLDALRMPAYPSNDRANLALAFDEVDWAGNFVPAIDRVYVARDPSHHHYWFPLTGSTVFLYPNAAHAPFSDVRVRKALSMAIDRERLVEVAVHGYTRPADATALSDAYTRYRDAKIADAEWVHHLPDRAEALLDEAGLHRGSDGARRRADGSPLELEILVVSGWSDWVRAAQVIARGLGAVGIRAQVRTYDFGAWYERLQTGAFDLSLGWSNEGPTPYAFYRWLMSPSTVTPLGAMAPGNWHRYGSAAAEPLLTAFERAREPVEQERLIRELSAVFSAEAPAIPLYPNPSWAEFNTRRVDGFPDAAHPYADPSPNKEDRGETLRVLTELVPR